jgi:RimJ/RimL family protein N-acetyltransferase
MIELRRFEREDCERLISWISDARFLLQWAGPQYAWPLDLKQVCDNLDKTIGEKPAQYMFKAIDSSRGEVVGHIELIRVDYEKRAAHIGRVLIGELSRRGNGAGKEMLSRLIEFAFGVLEFEELTLSVFDFNAPAIACYKSLGFEQYEFHDKALRFEDEPWNLIRMRLRKDED